MPRAKINKTPAQDGQSIPATPTPASRKRKAPSKTPAPAQSLAESPKEANSSPMTPSNSVPAKKRKTTKKASNETSSAAAAVAPAKITAEAQGTAVAQELAAPTIACNATTSIVSGPSENGCSGLGLSATETSDIELSGTEVSDEAGDSLNSTGPVEREQHPGNICNTGPDRLLLLAHAAHHVEVVRHMGTLGIQWAQNETANLNLLAEVADRASALQQRGVPLSNFIAALCPDLIAPRQPGPDEDEDFMDGTS